MTYPHKFVPTCDIIKVSEESISLVANAAETLFFISIFKFYERKFQLNLLND